MTRYNRAGTPSLVAYAAGSATPLEPDVVTGNVTLSNATTYYFEIGSYAAPAIVETALASFHLVWAAAVAAVFTIETSNLPRYRNGAPNGPDFLTPYYNTADGKWIPEDPAGAEVEVQGTGNTATGLAITAGGTNAGGAMVHVGNLGCARARIKAVVTTGGAVAAYPNAKLGA